MLRSQKKVIMLASSCFFICLSAKAVNAKELNDSLGQQQVSYYPQAYLGSYVFKNGPRAAVEGTLLVPLLQTPEQLFFSSFRALDKSVKPLEGNLALGYRCLNASHTNLFGVYGGVDHLRSVTGNSFNQINLGAETWLQDWFVGGNYYRPYGCHKYSAVGDELFSPSQNGGFRNVGFTQTTQRALPGFDAEIGRTLIDGLTIYGGGYYFHETGSKTLRGPKARAEYVFYAQPDQKILGMFDRVAFETVVTDDQVRGINYYGGFTVSMSWGGSHANRNLKGNERHMMDRIRHDVDMVTIENQQAVSTPFDAQVTPLDTTKTPVTEPVKSDETPMTGTSEVTTPVDTTTTPVTEPVKGGETPMTGTSEVTTPVDTTTTPVTEPAKSDETPVTGPSDVTRVDNTTTTPMIDPTKSDEFLESNYDYMGASDKNEASKAETSHKVASVASYEVASVGK